MTSALSGASQHTIKKTLNGNCCVVLCCVVMFCVVSSSLLCSLSSHVRCVFKSSLGNSVLGGSSHFFSGLCCCFRVRCSCLVAVLLLFICLCLCGYICKSSVSEINPFSL